LRGGGFKYLNESPLLPFKFHFIIPFLKGENNFIARGDFDRGRAMPAYVVYFLFFVAEQFFESLLIIICFYLKQFE
jgi:hypothetical protein